MTLSNILFFFIFPRKISLVISYEKAADSHEMSRLIFSAKWRKKKQKKKNRMTSTTSFAWHFKGRVHTKIKPMSNQYSKIFILFTLNFLFSRHNLNDRLNKGEEVNYLSLIIL